MLQTEAETFAAALDYAKRSAIPTHQFALEHGLTVDDAYRIQNKLIEKRVLRGATVCGLKAGFTSKAKMEQMGVDQIIFGRLTSDMQINYPDRVPLSQTIHPRAEPELAFRLAIDIDYALDFESAVSAVDAVAPALEIIDSRYENFQFTLEDVIADNSSSSHFTVGRWRPLTMDISALEMTLLVDDEPVLIGNSREISGHPVNTIVELSNLALKQGLKLKAGWIVLAGAATEAVAINGACKISCVVSGLGEVEVGVG